MQCELCGRPAARTRRFLVEGTVLTVGPECERFGKALDPGPGPPAVVPPGHVPLAMEMRQRRQASRDVFADESMQRELVADFGPRIRTARERKGWTRQDLGGRVGEREPTLQRIEAGQLRPTDKIARKMERELGIQLYEKVEGVAPRPAHAGGFTLGDALRGATDKKKKA